MNGTVMRRVTAWGMLAAAVALLASAGARGQAADPAGNTIEAVTATQSGGATVLLVRMRAPFGSVPNSFSVANPARVAIDLPQTVNGSGSNAVELNQGDLRSVNIVQAQGRTRLVLNLRRPLNYTVSNDGNVIQVALSASAETAAALRAAEPAPAVSAAAAVPVASPVAPPTRSAAAPRALRTLDFRRGADGEGRVVVDLSDPGIGVDVNQQGTQVIVDFLDATLPDSLRRRLDVTDFGTPVALINAVQRGPNVRVTVEPRGLWEHNAYQSDTRFVLEVKPVREDPTRLFQGTRRGYQGERLSLNFQNVEVRALLQVIADVTNLNIIASDSVGGNITLRLKDVPWDQALDIILQARGLDMRKNGSVLLVAPREELANKEKLELEARNQIADLEPLRTEYFQLNYSRAEQVRAILTDAQQRILSRRGSATLDPRTNLLIVNDTPAKLDEVRRLINRVDIPQRQVLIEARVVQADDKFGQTLGVRLGGSSGYPRRVGGLGFGNITGVSGGTTTTGPGGTVVQGVQGSGGVTTPSITSTTNFVNLPYGSSDGRYAGGDAGIAVTLFNATLSRFVSLEVQALEADGRGKVISSPRVVTADKAKAKIEQGTEIPYQQATSSGATSVSFRKAVLKLEVTPQITPEGSIFLDVKVNKDSPGSILPGGVAVDTKNVETQVLVENGGTVVLGGIYEQSERVDVVKIPFLGDLPVLGNLFQTRDRVNDRTELLIFITPRVLTSELTSR